MFRAIAYSYVCRLVVPVWLLAGAIFKLVELNPKLLPPPVLSVVTGTDGAFGVSGGEWLDLAMRIIVAGEFLLAAAMLTMPRFARAVSIATLALFCAILGSVIADAFREKGFEGVLKGSCGCFGSAGPNPLVMLGIDGVLLILSILARRSPRAMQVGRMFGLPACLLLTAIGAIAAAMSPARSEIDLTPVDPPKAADAVPAATAWPGLPAKAAPYYIPDFPTWLNTRLDSQEFARLMTPAPPESINQGTWFILLYRMDCDHCHELMTEHFTGHLATPVLAIAIPDTDPAASLEMPCEECQLRTLVKGPEYVLTTPVLLRLENGVITRMATDHEDTAALDACLAP